MYEANSKTARHRPQQQCHIVIITHPYPKYSWMDLSKINIIPQMKSSRFVVGQMGQEIAIQCWS